MNMQYLSADKEGKEHLGKSAGFNDEKKFDTKRKIEIHKNWGGFHKSYLLRTF